MATVQPRESWSVGSCSHCYGMLKPPYAIHIAIVMQSHNLRVGSWHHSLGTVVNPWRLNKRLATVHPSDVNMFGLCTHTGGMCGQLDSAITIATVLPTWFPIAGSWHQCLGIVMALPATLFNNIMATVSFRWFTNAGSWHHIESYWSTIPCLANNIATVHWSLSRNVDSIAAVSFGVNPG